MITKKRISAPLAKQESITDSEVRLIFSLGGGGFSLFGVVQLSFSQVFRPVLLFSVLLSLSSLYNITPPQFALPIFRCPSMFMSSLVRIPLSFRRHVVNHLSLASLVCSLTFATHTVTWTSSYSASPYFGLSFLPRWSPILCFFSVVCLCNVLLYQSTVFFIQFHVCIFVFIYIFVCIA